MSLKKLVLTLLISIFAYSGPTLADEIALNPNHPDRHVVVKGDTLWDISALFLRDPWLWPEIWHINPDISNPHLIYPGDVISLSYQNGKVMLSVQRGSRTMKLSPTMRATRIDNAIPTISTAALAQFLSHPRILTKEELETAGYIVGAEDDRLVISSGNRVYARNLSPSEAGSYSAYHIENPYKHPKTGEILGYEAKHTADLHLKVEGDPATLLVTYAKRETLIGDKVLPRDEDASNYNFIPHAPKVETNGLVISIFDGVSRAGTYQSLVLDLGEKDGIEKGHVLAIRKRGPKVRDYLAKTREDRWINLPSEKAALVMIYRVFEHISYGLIMNAEKDVREMDIVTNP